MIVRLFLIALLLMVNAMSCAQSDTVRWVGSMYATNKLGEMAAKVEIDSLVKHEHAYGIGPMAFMRGEITLIDDMLYVAEYTENDSLYEHLRSTAKAPFFVYTFQSVWDTLPFPDLEFSLSSLEHYLDSLTSNTDTPFAFRLIGEADSTIVHVVNIPLGAAQIPENIARNRFSWDSQEIEGIGFFSRHHQRIFTHHDSYLHLHAITEVGTHTGHVDAIQFQGSKMKLLLPRKTS